MVCFYFFETRNFLPKSLGLEFLTGMSASLRVSDFTIHHPFCLQRCVAFEVRVLLDCSQSPIFSWDRLDIPRLTVTGILIFKCTEGAGVGDYSWGGEKPPNRPRPLSSFDTHARWQPVTQSARSRWSYGKIEDCEQSSVLFNGRSFYTFLLVQKPHVTK